MPIANPGLGLFAQLLQDQPWQKQENRLIITRPDTFLNPGGLVTRGKLLLVLLVLVLLAAPFADKMCTLISPPTSLIEAVQNWHQSSRKLGFIVYTKVLTSYLSSIGRIQCGGTDSGSRDLSNNLLLCIVMQSDGDSFGGDVVLVSLKFRKWL